MNEPQNHIRNFCIIAHIDHGKSTLADRLLEYTGTLTHRELREQFLDDMDLERERGITIKAHAVRLAYLSESKEKFILNLIDTPGHVDFTYEVSRSLAACEGALLIVDATQGVEAQTIANANLALDNHLEIIPVINKIDLPSADIEKTKQQIEDILSIDADDAVLASAKEGIGIKDILERIVQKIPPPVGDKNAPLKALIFDSWFDNYEGAVVLIKIVEGTLKRGDRVRFMSTNKEFDVISLGVFTPARTSVSELSVGEAGCFTAAIKKVGDTKIGDTVTSAAYPAADPIPGYRDVKPMVFCGLYCQDTEEYENLKEALEKLRLNDSSFSYEPETSLALGFGFRCGFLGLLHMEIIQERLEREYNLRLISTAPTVVYRITTVKGEELFIDNPAKLPDPQKISKYEEPYIVASIITPEEYMGSIISLCQEKRGIQKDYKYLDRKRILVPYEMPLNEIILDFHDKLKSLTKGYASFDYELIGYRESDLVKIDILLNGETVDALSFITHRAKAQYRGKQIAEKLKDIIPRQMFEIAIQAAIGSKILARETIGALKKNVTAKCYGGDISRKRKLWEKQKEGKKRMKQIGKVEVPQEAFLVVLKIKD
ncbi:MAG: elongation factor 4 [Nitrospirae bacterium]|nr:elongation factor 4 [Nitrospirota bacterium]